MDKEPVGEKCSYVDKKIAFDYHYGKDVLCSIECPYKENNQGRVVDIEGDRAANPNLPVERVCLSHGMIPIRKLEEKIAQT